MCFPSLFQEEEGSLPTGNNAKHQRGRQANAGARVTGEPQESREEVWEGRGMETRGE